MKTLKDKTINKQGRKAIMKTQTIVKLENLKIDNTPLVLHKQLFCIVANETDIQGFWKDSKGKVYIDNIEVKELFAINEEAFKIAKKLLFAIGEEAVFYKQENNYAVIENKEGKKEVLKNRIAWLETRKPSSKYIEALLSFHNGLTIYKLEEAVYLIETYKA